MSTVKKLQEVLGAVNEKEIRMVALSDFYVYGKDKKACEKEAQEIADYINDKFDCQASIKQVS